jgi:AcrR family transcriptional regulator
MTTAAVKPPPLDVTGRHVVDVADDLFNARGIRSVRLLEVATASGVEIDEIRRLFQSKSGLVEVVLEARHVTWSQHIADATVEVPDSRDKLLAIFGYLEEWFAEDSFQGCVFINSYGELGRNNTRIAEMAQRHKESFVALVTDLALDAGLPRELGSSIALLAEGAQVSAAMTRTTSPARDARQAAAMLIALYQDDDER